MTELHGQAEELNEENGVRKTKMTKDNAFIAAFIVTILGGGGGTFFNIRSNNSIADKLDALTLKMVEVQGSIKASDTDKVRLQQEVHDQRIDLEHLRADLSDMKSMIKVLESKVK